MFLREAELIMGQPWRMGSRLGGGRFNEEKARGLKESLLSVLTQKEGEKAWRDKEKQFYVPNTQTVSTQLRFHANTVLTMNDLIPVINSMVSLQ